MPGPGEQKARPKGAKLQSGGPGAPPEFFLKIAYKMVQSGSIWGINTWLLLKQKSTVFLGMILFWGKIIEKKPTLQIIK